MFLWSRLPSSAGLLLRTSATRCCRKTRRPPCRYHSNGGTVGNDASTSTPKRPKIVFSGIQPTGMPHLGNYLGALSNWVQLQRDAAPEDQLIFSVVGWHALTLPQEPSVLVNAKRDMLAILLSVGLDPEKCIIFHQDDNHDHLELAWILNCLTPLGKLRRMTAWKSRLAVSRNANNESEVDESMLNSGLFTYPILQAADILAYKATHVPVGEDQQQHLELCRDLADSFNRTFGHTLFLLPEHIITPSKRVLSLRDPSAKMSKSALDIRSRINIIEEYSDICSKIRGAVTDSVEGITFDPVHRPGISNLLTILAGCTGQSVEEVAKRYASSGHGQFKTDVVDAVESVLSRPRHEFWRLKEEAGYLDDIAKRGAEKARLLSNVTLNEVRQVIGLSHT